MDEYNISDYKAIYFCGVSKKGYVRKENYEHNVHFAVEPCEGYVDEYNFENWKVKITNGKLLKILREDELNPKFFRPPYDFHYYTCRIFRWMVGYFGFNN